MKYQKPFPNPRLEKSTLWTDAGVDQNVKRDLGAIGPFLRGDIRMDQSLCALFSGKSLYGSIAPKVRQEFPLRLAMFHGYFSRQTTRDNGGLPCQVALACSDRNDIVRGTQRT